MLLQSIELQNFRQFINEKIDFSTDPERNVTLIIGENGTGKTTFAQAFFWCLYGETDFTNKTMTSSRNSTSDLMMVLPAKISWICVGLMLNKR